MKNKKFGKKNGTGENQMKKREKCYKNGNLKRSKEEKKY